MLLNGLLILVHIAWSSARQIGCDERVPICGNDGKTYTTMCQLIRARFKDTDLQVLHEGSCDGQILPRPLDQLHGDACLVTHIKSFKPMDNQEPKKNKFEHVQRKIRLGMRRMNSNRHWSGYGWPPRSLAERTFVGTRNNFRKTYKA